MDTLRYAAPLHPPERSHSGLSIQGSLRLLFVEELLELGQLMAELIEEDPSEVFLIEGHTDAVGSAAYNLTLSDRRAESVALALSELFNVPAANMVLQGYGETDLRVQTLDAERANRRVVVRRVTPLLQTAQAN